MVDFGLFYGHFERITNSKNELTGRLCYTDLGLKNEFHKFAKLLHTNFDMLYIAYRGYYVCSEKACRYLGKIKDIRDFDKKDVAKVQKNRILGCYKE